MFCRLAQLIVHSRLTYSTYCCLRVVSKQLAKHFSAEWCGLQVGYKQLDYGTRLW